MTTRIRFTINEGGRLGNSSKKVSIKNNSIEIVLDTLNHAILQNEVDNRFVHLRDDRKIEKLKNLKINFSNETQARKVYGLLHLKHKLKEGNKPWDFVINNIRYDRDELDENLKIDESNNTLTLNFDEFGSNLDNIDISEMFMNEEFLPHASFDGDLKNNRKELFELEDLLTNLENHYQTANAGIQNSVNDLNKLETYSKGDSIKQDLFDLRDSPGRTSTIAGVGGGDSHIFRGRINVLAKALEEFAVWNSIGFTSMEQILKANANGFIIAQRGGMKSVVTVGEKNPSMPRGISYEVGDDHLSLGTLNANAIIDALRGGKYRGLPIINPTQPSPTKTKRKKENTLFGYSCQEERGDYTKTKIDEFCEFIKVNMGQDVNEAIFDKRKYFGFEITDISSRKYYQDRSGCGAQPNKTKITYDIWAAPNLEGAIDLAFFSSPYLGMKNIDYNLLFLNEVDGKSKKETLDIYLNEGLKSDMCGRGSYLGIANNWYHDSYDNNPNSKKKVEEAYEVVEKWATILDWYERHTSGTFDKGQAKKFEEDLEKLKIAAAAPHSSYEKRLVNKWGTKIDEVISALRSGAPPGDNLPTDVLNKINGYLTLETDIKAQEVYTEAKKMKASDGITGTTVEELKELVDLVKNAYQGGSVDTLTKLEVFSSANSNSEAGKSWVIAKKVQDEAGKVWVEEALIKCRSAVLVEVQTKLKNVTVSEEIYQQIVTGIKNDPLAINHATEIFTWAKQTLTIKGTDETAEVKDLKVKLQTAQNHTGAWNAVNNYKENSSDTEGYAAKAWKKIQTFSERRQRVIEKSHLAEAKNKEELNQFYEDMKKGQNFTGSLKETVERKSFPRAQIIAAIREKGDGAKLEEKALIELIKDFVIKAEIDTDFGDNLNKENYQVLKNKQEGLTKYTTDGTSENNNFKSLPTEQQQTITLPIINVSIIN